MPMYEYECEECALIMERYRKIADREIPEPCEEPSCKGVAHVIVSRPAEPVFAMPHGEGAKREWNEKRRRQLEQRSNDFDKSAEGKDQRYKAIERQVKAGNAPPAMLKMVR